MLYWVVFGAAFFVSSFLANIFASRSLTQGRVSASPIPFTPMASADVPSSDAGGFSAGAGDACDGGGSGADCGDGGDGG
jgi:hypothetical protein